MSTLTSLVKSGKRKIIKTRTGFRTATKTALGRPDRRASQDPMRPQNEMLNASSLTTLGRPDQRVSPDPTRPQHDTPDVSRRTALGQPDSKVSPDPAGPQDDPIISA